MANQKERVAMMTYLDSDGEDCGSTAKPGLAGVRFDFVNKTGVDDDGKNTYKVYESEIVLFEEIGETCWDSCGAHGLKQKLSDAYAGAREKNLDPHEEFMSMVEQLQNDEWTVKRDGAGPRPSMVAAALREVLIAMGVSDDDSLGDKVKAATADAKLRKSALANPKVNEVYTRLQAEAAAKRAAKAAEAASAEDATGGINLDDFMGAEVVTHEILVDDDTPEPTEENTQPSVE